MKIETSNLSKSKVPSFWIAFLLGFSVAMLDNFVGFPVAVLAVICSYFMITQIIKKG